MRLSRRSLLAGSLPLAAFAAKPVSPKPNIVLILVDNLPAWLLGAYGNQEIKTPHLDLLAKTGTRFLHHIVCAPDPELSRATLLSGAAAGGGATLEKLLAGAGYTTASIDLGGAPKWLGEQSAGKTFFLMANDTTSLRPPYGAVSPAYAQTRFETLDLQRSAAPNARAGKEMLGDIIVNVRKVASGVSSIDERAGAVYSQLRERRLLDNTLIIFTGTCGALLGRHGLWDAAAASDPPNMFEEAVATPMIWSWPGHVPAQGVRPELISACDLAPTLADVAGAEPGVFASAQGWCGRSYLLLATGKPLPKKEPWPATVFSRYQNTAMARDHRYKLVLRDEGPGELYDLVADSGEKANQYDNPQFVTVRDSLSKSLAGWKQRCGGRTTPE